MKNRGFSLIEVLIFVTVFAMFFVLAASVVTTTLRISKDNQNRIRATHYAEDLKEWLEAERELNWGGELCGTCDLATTSAFTERVTKTFPAVSDFCFNDTVLSAWPTPGATNCNLTLDGHFRRIATFSATAVDGFVNQIEASISAEWVDGKEMHSVPLQTSFSIWE